MSDEEKKAPKMRCIACLLTPAPQPGMETIRMLAFCEKYDRDTITKSLCMEHQAMMVVARARVASAEMLEKEYDEVSKAKFAAMKPGEKIVGTCRECGRMNILQKGHDGEVISAHGEPLCEPYAKLMNEAKARGSHEHRGVYDHNTDEMRIVRPEELPS